MKIVSQSPDQLTLQDGRAASMVVGVVFAAGGIAAAVFLHAQRFGLWIGLAAFLIGVGIILFASSITVTATKSRNEITYGKKRIVGGGIATYAISDVFRIETRKRWEIDQSPPANNEAPRQPMLVAQSVIVFKTGKELPLDHQKTSSSTSVGGVTFQSGQAKESAMA